MSTEELIITVENGVLSIVINRPDQLGAVNGAMLLTAAEAITGADESVRVAVISGTGRAFCSGADLRGGPEKGSALDGGNALVRAITEAPFPVIAAINGLAAGIGVSVALAADITLARDSAYFLLAFVNIGLMPDGGSTELVAASIGRARANRLALLGERLPATEAAEIGLIYKALDEEAYDAELAALVEKFSNGPTRAYAQIKKAHNANTLPRLAETLASETEAQKVLAQSADHAEGKAAFLEKRPSRFTGK